jgi:homoserine dehydrogenase
MFINYRRLFMAKSIVKVGLIGFGTIGRGVVKLFLNSGNNISTKSSIKVELKKICDLDIRTDRGIKVPKDMLTSNIDDILNDPEIDIVIELMGGYKPALDFVLKALNSGKHVVTANKAMLSRYWDEINLAAAKNKVDIMAEASVGGGIPILRAMETGLAANRIEKIMAILNGTCNYILSKMTFDRMTFDAALKEAQAKGFAEANPTLDIEGFDTMHKIVILSTLAFGTRIKESDVPVQGIKSVDYTDIKYADEFGYVMKLLAIAERSGENSVNIRVHPALVSKKHLLASVNYEFNAIYLKGDAVGETLFYGKGAGEMPTASAVLSDVIHIAKNISLEISRKETFKAEKAKPVEIKNTSEMISKFYLRFNVVDKPGVLAAITGILGKNNIGIESVIQKIQDQHAKVPVVIMTYAAKEADLEKALKKIDAMEEVKEKTVMYRVVD